MISYLVHCRLVRSLFQHNHLHNVQNSGDKSGYDSGETFLTPRLTVVSTRVAAVFGHVGGEHRRSGPEKKDSHDGPNHFYFLQMPAPFDPGRISDVISWEYL